MRRVTQNKERKSMFYNKFVFSKPILTLALAGTVLLGGCSSYSLYEESNVNESNMEVLEKSFDQAVLTSDVDTNFLSALANHHDRFGGSTMNITVTYDPKSYRNTAMNATNAMVDSVATLRKFGVSDIESSILPIHAQGDDSKFMISYSTLSAKAPGGCDRLMQGMEDTQDDYRADYKLGCTIDTMIAKQISRPGDLMGTVTSDLSTDGREAANIVAVKRTGAPNEPLQGEQASGDN